MRIQFGVAMAVGLGLMLAGCDGPARAQGAKTGPAATASVGDERQVADTQEQLIRLLRVSPTLTSVVERDPSLLANAEYVSRSNPELEQFLVSHPEVARNPDFYLFSGLGERGQRRDALEKKVWPEYQGGQGDDASARMVEHIAPLLVFFCFIGVLVWLTQVFVRNRRWQRTFKAQMDAREKLIDRCSTNEQMMQYMEAAGKGLLEMPALNEGEDRMPNVVARVLTSLQIGVVLALLGIGMLILRHVVGPEGMGFMVLGVVFLMPGLGFLISAGISWGLAGRLGMLPKSSAEAGELTR
jgi:hypothetical protein